MTGSPFLRTRSHSLRQGVEHASLLVCGYVPQHYPAGPASQSVSGNWELVTRRRPTRLRKAEARLCLGGGVCLLPAVCLI